MIRLIAKNPDNLLSVLINREITIDQVYLIKELLDATDGDTDEALSFGEIVEYLGTHSAAPKVDLAEWGGIEQFQAEDR